MTFFEHLGVYFLRLLSRTRLKLPSLEQTSVSNRLDQLTVILSVNILFSWDRSDVSVAVVPNQASLYPSQARNVLDDPAKPICCLATAIRRSQGRTDGAQYVSLSDIYELLDISQQR